MSIFSKEELQKSIEEFKKMRLKELKETKFRATKHPIETERQTLIEKINRRQNEVRKFASFLKKKINDL